MSETLVHHEFIAGGDGWVWSFGGSVVQTSDGETRLVLPGPVRSAEAVEAFVLGYLEGVRKGYQWGLDDGVEKARASLRQMLGAADAESTARRLSALEGE